MTTSFKGESFGFLIAGDRTHDFTLPYNRATIPPKTAAAFDALLAARDAEQKTLGKKGKAADLDANAKVKEALNDLYDTASSTTVSRRTHHEEAYTFATLKLTRALAEAEAAIQALADHALQYANPVGVGIDPATRSKPVAALRAIADHLGAFPAVPPINA